jgi:hypothetical protein
MRTAAMATNRVRLTLLCAQCIHARLWYVYTTAAAVLNQATDVSKRMYVCFQSTSQLVIVNANTHTEQL